MTTKVITSAPVRISLFGGGTDLPIYYEKHRGLVISMAIDLRKHFKLSDEIPYDPNCNIFVKAFLDEFDLKVGFKEWSDIPMLNSGLGSSASMGVSIVAAISAYKDLKLTTEQIAEKAWEITNNRLGLFSGKQDEYAAAFGGFNRIEFLIPDILIHSLSKELGNFWQEHILLFNLNRPRTNTKIQEQFKNLTPDKIESLGRIREIAFVAYEAITHKDVNYVGTLMDDAWYEKQVSNPLVTNDFINEAYNTGIEAGALGGKLLGSGGGGHMIFIAEPLKQKEIIEAMKELGVTNVPFHMDEGVAVYTGVK